MQRGAPRGGGRIRIVGGIVVLNGSLLADGDYTNRGGYGAGSGGSIWLHAGGIEGTGTLSAKGGDSNTSFSGAGGGGRVFVSSQAQASVSTLSLLAQGAAGRLLDVLCFDPRWHHADV
jgi:hypothetical protein